MHDIHAAHGHALGLDRLPAAAGVIGQNGIRLFRIDIAQWPPDGMHIVVPEVSEHAAECGCDARKARHEHLRNAELPGERDRVKCARTAEWK